jgi:hypothetical protein
MAELRLNIENDRSTIMSGRSRRCLPKGRTCALKKRLIDGEDC